MSNECKQPGMYRASGKRMFRRSGVRVLRGLEESWRFKVDPSIDGGKGSAEGIKEFRGTVESVVRFQSFRASVEGGFELLIKILEN